MNNKNYPARNNIWLERQKKKLSQKQLAYNHRGKGRFIRLVKACLI